jgi:alpha-L-rhamnosidase
MYWIYGDTSMLTRQYHSMKRWVKYMEDSSRNDLWNKGFHFGDWLFYSIGDDRDGKSAVTDKYLIAQCFFAHSTQILLDAATLLGKTDDIIYYASLLDRVKKAFRKEYVTGSGRLISSTQTAYVLALHFDMLLPEQRAYAAELLAKNIESYNYHITTGFLGTPYICHVLSRYGYSDIAYKLLLQESYPSWLYPVKMGATTIWERWDGIKPDSSFQSASMNSFNHYAYGAIGDWMYRVIAGIEIEKAGYKESRIQPVLSPAFEYVSSSTITPYGKIASGWKKESDHILYTIEIPANTQSTVELDASSVDQVQVDGLLLDTSNAQVIQNKVHLKLVSGSYQIKVKTAKM